MESCPVDSPVVVSSLERESLEPESSVAVAASESVAVSLSVVSLAGVSLVLDWLLDASLAVDPSDEDPSDEDSADGDSVDDESVGVASVAESVAVESSVVSDSTVEVSLAEDTLAVDSLVPDSPAELSTEIDTLVVTSVVEDSLVEGAAVDGSVRFDSLTEASLAEVSISEELVPVDSLVLKSSTEEVSTEVDSVVEGPLAEGSAIEGSVMTDVLVLGSPVTTASSVDVRFSSLTEEVSLVVEALGESSVDEASVEESSVEEASAEDDSTNDGSTEDSSVVVDSANVAVDWASAAVLESVEEGSGDDSSVADSTAEVNSKDAESESVPETPKLSSLVVDVSEVSAMLSSLLVVTTADVSVCVSVAILVVVSLAGPSSVVLPLVNGVPGSSASEVVSTPLLSAEDDNDPFSVAEDESSRDVEVAVWELSVTRDSSRLETMDDISGAPETSVALELLVSCGGSEEVIGERGSRVLPEEAGCVMAVSPSTLDKVPSTSMSVLVIVCSVVGMLLDADFPISVLDSSGLFPETLEGSVVSLVVSTFWAVDSVAEVSLDEVEVENSVSVLREVKDNVSSSVSEDCKSILLERTEVSKVLGWKMSVVTGSLLVAVSDNELPGSEEFIDSVVVVVPSSDEVDRTTVVNVVEINVGRTENSCVLSLCDESDKSSAEDDEDSWLTDDVSSVEVDEIELSALDIDTEESGFVVMPSRSPVEKLD